jgi:predicted SAM-dependent methyltransferase
LKKFTKAQKGITDMRKLTSYTKIRALIGKLIRGTRIGIKKGNSKLLNVGCGPHTSKDYINLDYHWSPQIDICWDIVKKDYPIESNFLDGIYTEHCLEHIPYTSFEANCREFFRMLKSGGVVRIIMPDGELYLDIYQERKNGGSRRMPYEESYPTPMARINGIFRNHGHLFIYDFETVQKILSLAGFVDIKKESFRIGRMQPLLIDTDWRAHESLYVEATKP